MKDLVKTLINKATAFSRKVDMPNLNMMVGISHEYMGKTVPEDYSKIKILQKTKVTGIEYQDIKGSK